MADENGYVSCCGRREMGEILRQTDYEFVSVLLDVVAGEIV